MKIYKIGENKYYKGECSKCGTGVACSIYDDGKKMAIFNNNEATTDCIVCGGLVKLHEISREEYNKIQNHPVYEIAKDISDFITKTVCKQ